MKTLKLCLPILLSVALLGCNNEAVATTTQTISVQKVTPANVAKPKTTTLKQNDDSEVPLVESVTEPVEEVTEVVTPKKSAKSVNSNSAVKDVIIDGTGSLVLSKADGTFVSFAPVQGPVGPQGPAGPQGESIKGDKGDQGEPGKDGRGIDHLELDADKNLIAYYTDGTTQNVGNLTVTAPSDDIYSQINSILNRLEVLENKDTTPPLEDDTTDYGFIFEENKLVAYCGSSSNVVIPSKCTEIGWAVFVDNHFITSVIIPDTVTKIGENAFDGCDGLTSVIIPSSVTVIGNEAFHHCRNLATVTYKGVTYTNSSLLLSALSDNNITIGYAAFKTTLLE